MEYDISPLVGERESIFKLIHGMTSDYRKLQFNQKVPFLILKKNIKIMWSEGSNSHRKRFPPNNMSVRITEHDYMVNKPESSITYIIILYFACS